MNSRLRLMCAAVGLLVVAGCDQPVTLSPAPASPLDGEPAFEMKGDPADVAEARAIARLLRERYESSPALLPLMERSRKAAEERAENAGGSL